MTEQIYQLGLPRKEGEAPTLEPVEAVRPKEETTARRKRSEEAKEKAKPIVAPGLVVLGLVTVIVVIMTLMSYAQLVMVNDDVFQARSELKTLQTEETKLMAQYELAYDLQEIETQMLSSGEMIKIQSWQTYTLELAEPDTVEYYQSNKLGEKIKTLASGLLDSLREYF